MDGTDIPSAHSQKKKGQDHENSKQQSPLLALALAALVLNLSAIQQVKGAGFVSVSPMHQARIFFTATLLPNGKVLVAGGFPTGTSAELYNPATDAWTVTGSLRAARTFHTATLLPNGKVLVAVGGLSGGSIEASTSTELYDPATERWAPTGPMKLARCCSPATLLPNGKVLVVGGGTAEASCTTQLAGHGPPLARRTPKTISRRG